jgi:hypothetical protein
MQRGDASMKERLAQFQRRHSEALMPRGPGQGPPPPAAPGQAPPPAAGQTPVPGQAPRSARDSGLMRRFFGGK